MIYYEARLRKADGRWDFTAMRPVGYCQEYPWTGEKLAKFQALVGPYLPTPEELGIAEANRQKYHMDGHTTKEEAERCWYGYQLDHLRAFETSDHVKYRCAACNEYTHGGMEVRHGASWSLCLQHRTRETVETLWPFTPGAWIASSLWTATRDAEGAEAAPPSPSGHLTHGAREQGRMSQ